MTAFGVQVVWCNLHYVSDIGAGTDEEQAELNIPLPRDECLALQGMKRQRMFWWPECLALLARQDL